MRRIDEPEEGKQAREQARAREELGFFVQLLHRRVRVVRATRALLAINVAVYLSMVLSGVSALTPDPSDVLAWGAVRGPEVFGGEGWRLFTCMFLHFGLLHIGFNMWVLKSIGPFVERLFGHLGFLVIYLVAGLFASAIGLAWNPLATSAGASGAIFGVVGGLLAALVVRPPEMPPAFAGALRGSLLKFIGLNVVLGLAVPQIGLAAHLGGLVGGFACGLALGPRGLLRERPRSRRLERAALVTLAGLAGTAAAASIASSRFDPVLGGMLQFQGVEREAIETYNEAVTARRAGGIGDGELARVLERDVLPPWRDMRERLEELRGRAGAGDRRLDVLLRYVGHRERAWELQALAARTGDDAPLEEMVRQRELAERAAEELADETAPDDRRRLP